MEYLKRSIVRGVMNEKRLMELALNEDMENNSIDLQWYVLENFDALLAMIQTRQRLVNKTYEDAIGLTAEREREKEEVETMVIDGKMFKVGQDVFVAEEDETNW